MRIFDKLRLKKEPLLISFIIISTWLTPIINNTQTDLETATWLAFTVSSIFILSWLLFIFLIKTKRLLWIAIIFWGIVSFIVILSNIMLKFGQYGVCDFYLMPVLLLAGFEYILMHIENINVETYTMIVLPIIMLICSIISYIHNCKIAKLGKGSM